MKNEKSNSDTLSPLRRQEPEHRSHTGPPAPTEPPVCTRSSLCRDCPFPGHGFLCWGEDGECMRTRYAACQDKSEKEEHP